jgi:hypothetical protein
MSGCFCTGACKITGYCGAAQDYGMRDYTRVVREKDAIARMIDLPPDLYADVYAMMPFDKSPAGTSATTQAKEVIDKLVPAPYPAPIPIEQLEAKRDQLREQLRRKLIEREIAQLELQIQNC